MAAASGAADAGDIADSGAGADVGETEAAAAMEVTLAGAASGAQAAEAAAAASILGKVIVFRIEGQLLLGKVLRTRPAEEDPEKGMTHEIKYIHGATGNEWVKLDEDNNLFSDEFGHDGIEYKIYEKATAKAATSTAGGAPPQARGGRGRGAGRGRGSRRSAKNPWKRYKVTSDRKVGILPKPDVNLEVAQHLKPGEEFDVVQELLVGSRKYWRMADGRGWVPECSRKDPNKVVVAAVDPPAEPEAADAEEGPAAEEAPEAAAAAAAPAETAVEAPAEAPPEDEGEGGEPGAAIAESGANEPAVAADVLVAEGARWEVAPSRRERVDDSERAVPKARGAGRGGGAGRGRGVGKARRIQVGETVVVKGRFGLVTLDLRPEHSFVMVQWLNAAEGEEEATIHTKEIKEVITAEEAAAREAAQAEAAAKAAEEAAAAAEAARIAEEEAKKAEEEAKKAEEEAERASKARGGRRKGRGRGRGGSRLAGQDAEECGNGEEDGEEAKPDAGEDSDDAPLVKNPRKSAKGRGRGARRGGGDAGDEDGGAPAGDADEDLGSGERRWPKGVPTFEELPEGTIPADKDVQYSALIHTTVSELRKMLKQVDLPVEGAKHELAIRIIRELSGLPPTEADAKVFEEHEQQELAKIEKAQGKGKGKGKGKGRFVRGASLKTIGSSGRREEDEEGSGDEDAAGERHGPRKADLRTFVTAFIDNSNLETARLRDLNDALEKQFGELPPKVLIRARRIAEKALVAKQEAEDAEGQDEAEEEGEAGAAEAVGEEGEAAEGDGGAMGSGDQMGDGSAVQPEGGPAEGETAQDDAEGAAGQPEEEEDEGGDPEAGGEEKTGPRMKEIRKHVKEFVYGVDLEAVRLRDLYDALEKKLGALSPKTLERVQRVARRVIMERLEKEELKKQQGQASAGDVPAQAEEETKAVEAQEPVEPAPNAQEQEPPDETKEEERAEASTDKPKEAHKDDAANSDEEDKAAEEDQDDKSSSSSDSSSEEEKEAEDKVSEAGEKNEEKKESEDEAPAQDQKEQTPGPSESVEEKPVEPEDAAQPSESMEEKPVEPEDAAQPAEPTLGQEEQQPAAVPSDAASPQRRKRNLSETENAGEPAEEEQQPAATPIDATSPQRKKRDVSETGDASQPAEPMQGQEEQQAAAVAAKTPSPQRRKRKMSEVSEEAKHDGVSPEKDEADKSVAAVEKEVPKQSDDEEDKEAEAAETQKGEKRKGKAAALGQDKKRKLQGDKASPAVKAGLAARMSIKNVDGTLLGDLFGGGGGHQPLGATAAEAAEKQKVFAISREEELQKKRAKKLERKKQEELQQKEQEEKQLVDRIHGKLKSWVQECLVEEERRQKMADKGVLRFPIQALPSSSESFLLKLRNMVDQYGGEIVRTKRQVTITPKATSGAPADTTEKAADTAQKPSGADVAPSSAQQGDGAPPASETGVEAAAAGDAVEADAASKASGAGTESVMPGGASEKDAAMDAPDAKEEAVVPNPTPETDSASKPSAEVVESAAPADGTQGADVAPGGTEEAKAAPEASENAERPMPESAEGAGAEKATAAGAESVAPGGAEANAVASGTTSAEAAAPMQDVAASNTGTQPPAAEANAAAQTTVEKKDVWLVTFNLAAFDSFVQRHPDVVEPPTKSVKKFISDFVQKADVETLKLRDMFDALKKKFGAIRRPLLERTKVWAGDAIQKKMKNAEKKAAADASKYSKRGSEGQPVPKQFVAGGGDADESECAQIEGVTDINWAIALLVPWGFRQDKGDSEPMLRPPSRIVLPVLLGLQSFHKSKEFREVMKTTQLGKAVNCMRRHPSAEVSKAAKNLVLSWKTAMTQRGEKRPKPAES